MHVRSSLIASLLIAGCAERLAIPLGLARIDESLRSLSACIDYQPCRLSGVVSTERWPDRRTASLAGPGRGCVPLLLDERQFAAAARASGRNVTVEGAALVRLVDGQPETLAVSYLDRSLAMGVCPGSRSVLYVTKLTSR